MRVLEFDVQFSPKELAEAIEAAGFFGETTLATVASGHREDDADDEVTLTCAVDEDDVLEGLGDEAILKAAADVYDGATGRDREIEDGLRYVRSGDLRMAATMFGRVLEGSDLAAVERALS